MFLIVNPIATITLIPFMGLVPNVLNKHIAVRLKTSGEAQIEGFRKDIELARDLNGIKREAKTAGAIR